MEVLKANRRTIYAHTYTDTHQTRKYVGELIVPHSNARRKKAHNDGHAGHDGTNEHDGDDGNDGGDGDDGDDGNNGHDGDDGDDGNKLRRKSQRAGWQMYL